MISEREEAVTPPSVTVRCLDLRPVTPDVAGSSLGRPVERLSEEIVNAISGRAAPVRFGKSDLTPLMLRGASGCSDLLDPRWLLSPPREDSSILPACVRFAKAFDRSALTFDRSVLIFDGVGLERAGFCWRLVDSC